MKYDRGLVRKTLVNKSSIENDVKKQKLLIYLCPADVRYFFLQVLEVQSSNWGIKFFSNYVI